ncbi:MAG: thioredoxin domain-containing protein [Betaproteobacteria bacterium]|nr:thioredoxin domain-containing protein [Betaproteobacteria bacterium]
MNRKLVFGGSVGMLLGAFVVGSVVYKVNTDREKVGSASRNSATLVRFHSPTLGNPEAKVHIVEFLDPACETCRSLYPYVKQLIAANPDRVRLSVRHAPFHKGSDAVVRALEAARKQGKYWPALEAVLSSQSSWAIDHAARLDLLWPVLASVGLNVEQLKIDMNAPDIAQRVELDLGDARLLKVTKTPEFFVNGRPLPSFGLDQLQALVRSELAANY